MKRYVWLCVLLSITLIVSALLLVTARFQSRQLFIALTQLQEQAHALETEWRVLRVARAQQAQAARIDQIARQTLKMVPRTPERTLYIKPGVAP